MAHALTLIVPISPTADLGALQKAIGQGQDAINQALTTIGTVHDARFVLFDASTPTLQPSPTSKGPFQLAVITTYDGDFSAYIQDFVNMLGPVFDAVLSFSADGTELLPVKDHAQQFATYVQSHDASQQLPSSAFGFYTAYPYTVQEILADMPATTT